jgi:hypothetical protein
MVATGRESIGKLITLRCGDGNQGLLTMISFPFPRTRIIGGIYGYGRLPKIALEAIGFSSAQPSSLGLSSFLPFAASTKMLHGSEELGFFAGLLTRILQNGSRSQFRPVHPRKESLCIEWESRVQGSSDILSKHMAAEWLRSLRSPSLLITRSILFRMLLISLLRSLSCQRMNRTSGFAGISVSGASIRLLIHSAASS